MSVGTHTDHDSNSSNSIVNVLCISNSVLATTHNCLSSSRHLDLQAASSFQTELELGVKD